MTVFVLIKAQELPRQSVLCFEGDGHDLWWLSLSTAIQIEGGSGVMSVVPCCLNEQSTNMNVAGCGDGSPVLLLARRVFRGDETEAGHELAWRRTSPDVVHLAKQRERGENLDTT